MMWKTTLAFLVLAGLVYTIGAAGPVAAPGQDGDRKVIVGEEDIKLYPRFNKSLTPLAELKSGQTLLVLREFKAWKNVKVEDSGQEGWISVAVKKTAAMTMNKYDTVADPSTTGLVSRGWSRKYAMKHGADFARIEEIEKRTLDTERYLRFIEEEEQK
jgi:hypothetical protein